MKIDSKILRASFDKILSSIEERYGDKFEINLTEDFYWDISKDELYNMNLEPKQLSIGSLHDDAKEISKINDQDLYPTAYNLKKLNSILRFIAEELN